MLDRFGRASFLILLIGFAFISGISALRIVWFFVFVLLCVWFEDFIKKPAKVENPVIGVIGCGPNGLACAARALESGYQVTVFEKQSGIGGDWLRFGNEHSKLQSHLGGVLIDGTINPSERGMPTYPSRKEMLDYYNAWADAKGIRSHIRFEATVLDVDSTPDGGHSILYEQGGIRKTFQCTHVYSAPGRQGSVNKKVFPGEDKFSGTVALGVSGDIDELDFQDKHVVIVGAGSFAIENARTACEKGAALVTIVTRGNQFVMPRAVEAMLERHYHICTPIQRDLVVDNAMKMYNLIDNDPLTRREALDDWLNNGKSFTLVPTSDVYFLLRALGKLKVVLGVPQDFAANSVITSDGQTVPADILIKCTGFNRNLQFDKLVAGEGTDLDADEFYKQYGHRFIGKDATKFICWQRYFPWPGAFHDYSQKDWPRPTIPVPTSGYVLPFFHTVEGQSHKSLLGRLLYVLRVSAFYVKHGRAIEAMQTDQEFISEQAAEWATCCKKHGREVPYPYKIEDMQSMRRSFSKSGSLSGRLVKSLSTKFFELHFSLRGVASALSGFRPRMPCELRTAATRHSHALACAASLRDWRLVPGRT